MSDAFTRTPNFTPYTATIPGNLCTTPVDSTLVPACTSGTTTITAAVPLLHNSQWWAAKTKGFNFRTEDRIDPQEFNEILWAGIKGENIPYPETRSRADLRKNRSELLKRWQLGQTKGFLQSKN
jgi:DNA-binding beta-propeller fold protein YncE